MFFYLLSLIMLSRLYSLFRDEAITLFKLVIMMAIQLFFLMFINLTFELFVLMVILFSIGLIELFIEKKSARLNLIRFILFLIFIII
jgi:hypothetical protein